MSPVRYLDSETFLIARAALAPRAVCVQDRLEGSSERILEWGDDARERVFRILAGGEILAGINLAYDMGVFGADSPTLLELVYRAYDDGRVEEIALNQRIVDFANGKFSYAYSLEDLADRYRLAHVKDSPWRYKFGTLASLRAVDYPIPATHYALEDVVLPGPIRSEVLAQAAAVKARLGHDPLKIAPEKARTAWMLHLLQCHGVHTHPGRTRSFKRSVETRLAKIRSRLTTTRIAVREPNRKYWGKRKDGVQIGEDGRYVTAFVDAKGKAKQIAAKTYMKRLVKAGRLGGDLPLTEKGAVSISRDAAQSARSPILTAFVDYSSARKKMKRVASLEEGHDYPLQPRFNPMLVTGRTSCSDPRAKNPTSALIGTQLQNPDKAVGVRECFTTWHPDWRFFDCDFPSAELHALAQIQIAKFRKSVLGDLLNARRNVLLWFGCTVLNGIPYEEAERRLKAGDKAIKDMRQGAKAPIYGFPGGLGTARMVDYARTNFGQIVDERTTKRWKEAWMDALRMGPYFEWINKTLGGREKGTMVVPISGLIRGGAFFTELANLPFQSLTAMGACDAAYHVQRECDVVRESPLYGCIPWNFVHDQSIVQGPADRAAEAVEHMAPLMCERYNRWTPDVPVRPDGMACVMSVWSKGAEPVRDVRGKLVPWEPKCDACSEVVLDHVLKPRAKKLLCDRCYP